MIKEKKPWWQRKVKLIEVDNMLRLLMQDFANTPLDKRKTGWNWLLRAKKELEELGIKLTNNKK